MLNLVPLAPTLRGIYPLGSSPNGKLPKRMLWAHPDLAAALAKAEAAGLALVFSDLYRSPAESRAARKARPGLVQPPGFSAHNAGLAADLDIAAVIKLNGLGGKADLDGRLEALGLWCHRRDHLLGSESWHVNALGVGVEAQRWLAHASATSTAGAVEAKMQALYKAQWDALDVEDALAELGYLGRGRTVGEAVKAFQGDYDLRVAGAAGPVTRRVLWFCANQPKG